MMKKFLPFFNIIQFCPTEISLIFLAVINNIHSHTVQSKSRHHYRQPVLINLSRCIKRHWNHHRLTAMLPQAVSSRIPPKELLCHFIILPPVYWKYKLYQSVKRRHRWVFSSVFEGTQSQSSFPVFPRISPGRLPFPWSTINSAPEAAARFLSWASVNVIVYFPFLKN